MRRQEPPAVYRKIMREGMPANEIDGARLIMKCASSIKQDASDKIVDLGMVSALRKPELLSETHFVKSRNGYNVCMPESLFIDYELESELGRKEVESEVQDVYDAAEIREVSTLLAEAQGIYSTVADPANKIFPGLLRQPVETDYISKLRSIYQKLLKV